MNSHPRQESRTPVERQRGPREPEEEHQFWCRYWEIVRFKGVPTGRELWYERACARFIRELKPRRLKEAGPDDVTRFLGLMAVQPDAAAWRIRQADEALRILLAEMVHCAWAERWPVGLPELDGWMQGPEGGGKMPVPADSAQARFASQVHKMIATLRCLHYSYRTEEAYVGWARRFLSFANAQAAEDLGASEVRAFLEKLAIEGKVSASTQNQALNALVPEGLSRKYPNACKEWSWQYVFPADRLSVDPRSGRVRRHHACENTLQKAVSAAVRQAEIAKLASCHSLRHSFAPTALRTAMTFGPCRSCLATKAWRLLRSIRT